MYSSDVLAWASKINFNGSRDSSARDVHLPLPSILSPQPTCFGFASLLPSQTSTKPERQRELETVTLLSPGTGTGTWILLIHTQPLLPNSHTNLSPTIHPTFHTRISDGESSIQRRGLDRTWPRCLQTCLPSISSAVGQRTSRCMASTARTRICCWTWRFTLSRLEQSGDACRIYVCAFSNTADWNQRHHLRIGCERQQTDQNNP